MAAADDSVVSRLCHEALQLDEAPRRAFLDRACKDDEALRQEVESLLVHAPLAEHFIETPAVVVASGWVPTPEVIAPRDGETVSHYRIVNELGRGGMGIVYYAEDTKLGRTVALKFLPPDLTRDAEAKLRFIQEARTASALDHPNICTIFEVDEAPDGQMFLAMARYHGETLKTLIARGPLPPMEACELAAQVARGLRKAHDAGIIHRDIKPANLFLTTDGIVKILDFGIAKLTGAIGNTRTGTAIGTIAYMSPEQIRGEGVDARSDLWALGVVLYELLTGRAPFAVESTVAVMHSVLHEQPRAPRDIVATMPPAVEAVVMRALAKKATDRFSTAAELIACLADVTSHLSRTATDGVVMSRWLRKPAVLAAGVILLLTTLVLSGLTWNRARGARWARTIAVPQIAQLVDRGEYVAAFDLAAKARAFVPDDPLLKMLTPRFATTLSIDGSPSDVEVFLRPYGEVNQPWRLLGRSPLTDVQLPRQVYRWKFEKPGYETTELATTVLASQIRSGRLSIALDAVGQRPPDMVAIPAGASGDYLNDAALPGLLLPTYYIDRYEVTNRAFKEFVDAGGYADPAYWEGLDFKTVGSFVDSTGRPGPSTWELGTYPADHADHPVAGVSWHEAVAYGRFRGKTLPTVHHWARAALPPGEIGDSLAASIVPLSNFSSAGPARVGQHQGLGPYGTYDMQGNVWEWCWNESSDPAGGGGRYAVGGAWDDPDYVYRTANAVSPLDRSPARGFRLMKEVDPGKANAAARAAIVLEPPQRVGAALHPVADDVFNGYREQFTAATGPLNPTARETLATTDSWTKERLTIAAGYNNEHFAIYLFLPRHATPPFQPLVYFPGTGAFSSKASSNIPEPGFPAMPLDFLVKSGRAFVAPVFQGLYERQTPLASDDLIGFQRRLIDWRSDLGRTLDYLQTQPDIDSDHAAFVGVSYGASYALPLLALEPRLQTALLLSGGLPNTRFQAMADPINYVSRITMPVLMVSGRFDFISPVETSQKPLFALLGTPADKKSYYPLDSGHGSPPRAEILKLTVDWLDKYLGPTR